MKEKKLDKSKNTSLLLLVLALAAGLLVGFKIIKPLMDEGRVVRVVNPVGAHKQLMVGNERLLVEVRDTEGGRELGLSGRESLSDDRGMLFVFESKQQPLFWMKDMLISLDMVWILDGKVVQIDENVPPPTKDMPRVATRVPVGLADSVLEVAGGWVGRHGLRVGDAVKFDLTDYTPR